MNTRELLLAQQTSTQDCINRNVARRAAATRLGFYRQAEAAQKMIEACLLDLVDISRELGDELPL